MLPVSQLELYPKLWRLKITSLRVGGVAQSHRWVRGATCLCVSFSTIVGCGSDSTTPNAPNTSGSGGVREGTSDAANGGGARPAGSGGGGASVVNSGGAPNADATVVTIDASPVEASFDVASGDPRRPTIDASMQAVDARAEAGRPDTTLSSDAGPATDLEPLKRAFAEWRFGMFLHFGMNTFSNDTGSDLPNQNPALYNPTALDPGQWLDAAKAAGMKFAVLTTKHHDGFLLWDSATTTYDVMNPAVPATAQKDVVKLFVDACRARDIVPGLYFSVRDRGVAGLSGRDTAPFNSAWGAVGARIDRQLIDYVKAQIRELLTNYGFIPFFVTDGWAWSMGHTIIPYQEIRELIHQVSPNTLYGEHQGLLFPWQDDVVYYEEPKGGAFAPAGNVLASWQAQRTGHTWFWTPPDHPNANGFVGMTLTGVVNDHLNVLEPRYCNFVMNFGPNRQGLLEPAQVALLQQVGQTWTPNLARAPLPAQPPHIEHPITAVGATASSTAAGSDPRNAIDGVSDGGFTDHYTQTVWQSAAGAPSSLTVDLGAVYTNIEMLTYLPPQIAPQQATVDTTGRVTGYRIEYGTDGTTFDTVALRAGYDGAWAWNDADLTGWRAALFAPVSARYVRFTATSSTGTNVRISEVDVGGNLLTPVAN